MDAEQSKLITPPATYADWLDCLETVKSRTIRAEEYRALCNGSCDSADAAGYLESQIVAAVNGMIRLYIKEFKRRFELHMMFNERENLTQIFRILAGRLEYCLFFEGLEFLRADFRTELRASIFSEVESFWSGMLRTMHTQCMDQNDELLEHELYMIRRIKLFRANGGKH